MKISKIISTVKNEYLRGAAIRKDLKVDKYFKINNNCMSPEIYNARQGISRYAKANDATIEIMPAGKVMFDDSIDSSIIEEHLADKLYICATDTKTGNMKSKIISGDRKKIYPKVSEQPVLIHVHKDGTEKFGLSRTYVEDNFLRNLYRNIEDLIKNLKQQNK